jgi:nitroreductase
VSTTSFDLAETDRLLSTTRAVRKRLDLERPVEPSVILDCIRLAQQAPTGSNQQTWRWVVVTDPEHRAEIARLYSEAGRAYLEVAAQTTEDPQTRRVYESAVALTDTLAQVPVHVIPCIEGRLDGVPNGIAAGAYGSILPAVWSFCLALRARDLGSVWTTLHLFKEREVADLLGIPYDTITQVALLPVAYTIGTDFKPATRPDPGTITYFGRWGSTDG